MLSPVLILEWINKYLFSLLLPILIFGAGIYFTVALRFFNIIHPIKFFRVFFPRRKKINKKPKDNVEKISPFKAVTLALAGTLGVGNIIGVSAAIMSGGAGAVFWMWCSAAAAMIVKYAEIVLAVKTRIKCSDENGKVKYHGGAMYYIRNKYVAITFAILCTISSFFLGNIIQIKAASDAMQGTFGISPLIVGISCAIVCAAVVGGGIGGISDFTVKIIPLLSVLYIIASMYIIVINRSHIPEVILRIFSEAFRPEAAVGGIGGFLLSRGLRYGITRGLFSNEAGCGTAPIAHSEADTIHPAAQGCWGIFEVFTDTILLCTMTAFVVIFAYDTVGASCIGDSSGMMLALKSYSLYLGNAAGIFIALSTAVFALATLVCWSHYGIESIYYITSSIDKKNTSQMNSVLRRVYIFLYCAAAIAGSILSGDLIWSVSDFAVGIMTTVNIIAIMQRRSEIIAETKSFFSKKKNLKRDNFNHLCHQVRSLPTRNQDYMNP